MDYDKMLETVKVYLSGQDPVAAAEAAFMTAFDGYEDALAEQSGVGKAHLRMMGARAELHLTEAAMKARNGIRQHGWNPVFDEIMQPAEVSE